MCCSTESNPIGVCAAFFLLPTACFLHSAPFIVIPKVAIFIIDRATLKFVFVVVVVVVVVCVKYSPNSSDGNNQIGFSLSFQWNKCFFEFSLVFLITFCGFDERFPFFLACARYRMLFNAIELECASLFSFTFSFSNELSSERVFFYVGQFDVFSPLQRAARMFPIPELPNALHAKNVWFGFKGKKRHGKKNKVVETMEWKWNKCRIILMIVLKLWCILGCQMEWRVGRGRGQARSE